MLINPMSESDFKLFWPTFKNIVVAEETYAFDPNLSYIEAKQLWLESPLRSYAAKQSDTVLGSYYIKKNAAGPGDHICNCGYMVSANARGKGVARALCLHSQALAQQLGFKAMQFNSVVSSNTIAIALWQKLGFQIIGTVPNGYRHKQLGLVDSFIMYKALTE